MPSRALTAITVIEPAETISRSEGQQADILEREHGGIVDVAQGFRAEEDAVADADGMTATEVATAVGITLAKATALLTQLVKSEEVKREVEKKVARFYIA